MMKPSRQRLIDHDLCRIFWRHWGGKHCRETQAGRQLQLLVYSWGLDKDVLLGFVESIWTKHENASVDGAAAAGTALTRLTTEGWIPGLFLSWSSQEFWSFSSFQKQESRRRNNQRKQGNTDKNRAKGTRENAPWIHVPQKSRHRFSHHKRSIDIRIDHSIRRGPNPRYSGALRRVNSIQEGAGSFSTHRIHSFHLLPRDSCDSFCPCDFILLFICADIIIIGLFFYSFFLKNCNKFLFFSFFNKEDCSVHRFCPLKSNPWFVLTSMHLQIYSNFHPLFEWFFLL